MSSHVPSRRDFLLMGTGVFAVSALGVTSARRHVVRRSVPVMGTIAEVAVIARNTRHAQGAIDAALRELQHVDVTMSRFSAASDIGRANAAAAVRPIAVSTATAHVVREALRWAATDGSGFDPALARVSEVWNVSENTAPPDARIVRRLAGRQLYRAVEVDENTLRYSEADVALDLGGIAKGYAVDRAVAALRDWGIVDGLVNAGGDLYALGNSAEGDPWRVGIRSPSDPDAFVATLTLSDRAVATSGDYEQYFMYRGRRYHHLLDPRTAAPRETAVHSLSIAADSCINADAAATAVYGLPLADAEHVLARIDRSATVAHMVT
jgi:thiamine biosynthesis lipoprotein